MVGNPIEATTSAAWLETKTVQFEDPTSNRRLLEEDGKWLYNQAIAIGPWQPQGRKLEGDIDEV